MSRRIFSRILFAILLLTGSLSVQAADDGVSGAYSPYSIFGLGDIAMPGTAYNRSMAGVGIASRDNHYINPLNPAAVTARDSLAFMVDFSLFGENKMYRQGDSRSAHNTFGIGDCIITFPIWKSLSMIVGIMPFSNTGYGYTSYVTDKSILADYGSTVFSSTGLGSVYQLFAGAGFTLWDRLSLGAQGIMYFGNINKSDMLTYGDASRPNISTTYTSEITSYTGKLGFQYEQPVGNSTKIGLGGTYRFATSLGGYLEKELASTTNSTVRDTLAYTPGRLRISDEIGAGISINYSDKFRAEFDYTRSDWRSSHFDTDPFFKIQSAGASFSTSVSQSFRFGIEYVPNRSDIRYYYKKIAYRAGIYHVEDYYKVSGHSITSNGVTIGATLPVFRWYNGVTFAADFGQRGTIQNNLIRETYFNFSVSVNLFDIWFQKPKYE